MKLVIETDAAEGRELTTIGEAVAAIESMLQQMKLRIPPNASLASLRSLNAAPGHDKFTVLCESTPHHAEDPDGEINARIVITDVGFDRTAYSKRQSEARGEKFERVIARKGVYTEEQDKA